MRKLKHGISQIISIIHLFLLGKLTTDHKTIILNENEKEANVGYYDLPVSSLNDTHIAYTERVNMRSSEASDITYIYTVDHNLKNKKKVIETHAWNSQLGSRLMWSHSENDVLFYLDLENGHLVTKKVNIVTGDVLTYPFQSFCLDVNDKGFYGLDYGRLYKSRPGYGYINNPTISSINNDGLLYYSISRKEEEVIVSYKEMFDFLNLDPIGLSDIRLNHIQMNYDGTRIIFLLRYQIGRDSFSHMIMLDTTNSSLLALPFGPHISHACWMNNNEIVLWAKHLSKKEPAFYKYNINHDSINLLDIKRDGHPYKIDENKFICDTYNNSARQRELFVYNLNDHSKQFLGKFFTGFKYSGSKRCDLHPRINRKRDKFIIDVSYTGKRNIAYGEL